MNTHESYVSLEIAKMLKEAGFDWFTQYVYLKNKRRDVGTISCSLDQVDYYPCPTLDVAQRWLREEKQAYVDIDTDYIFYTIDDPMVFKDDGRFMFWTQFFGNTIGERRIKDENGRIKYFDTYEAALEKGIQRCLTYILEENETEKKDF